MPTIKKPDIIQAVDYYVDRDYYKIIPWFLWNVDRKVRTDRLDEWKQWNIRCDTLPDVILINGEKYRLKKIKETNK